MHPRVQKLVDSVAANAAEEITSLKEQIEKLKVSVATQPDNSLKEENEELIKELAERKEEILVVQKAFDQLMLDKNSEIDKLQKEVSRLNALIPTESVPAAVEAKEEKKSTAPVETKSAPPKKTGK